MNGKELLLAFAEIDDGQIRHSNNIIMLRRGFKEQRVKKIRMVSAVCCILAVCTFASVVGMLSGGDSDPSVRMPHDPAATASADSSYSAAGGKERSDDETVPIITSPNDRGTTDGTEDSGAQNATADRTGTTTAAPRDDNAECYIIPRWEDKEVYEKYTTLEYNGNEYRIGRNAIDPEYIGRELGKATSTGYDVYTETIYELEISVFSLNCINDRCAVGVRFDGGMCFAYLNMDYTPATLSQFIDDLSLRSELQFGRAHYDYIDGDMQPHTVTFDKIDDGIVWGLLFSDTSLANTGDTGGKKLIDIPVSMPELGYNNQALWVTEDGFVVTNILDSPKSFHIGAERAGAFMDYMLANVHYTDISYTTVYSDTVPE